MESNGLDKLTDEQIDKISGEVGEKMAKMMNSLISRTNKLLEKEGLPIKVKLQYLFEKTE